MFFSFTGRNSGRRGGAEGSRSRGGTNQAMKRVYQYQRTFVFLPHQVEKRRSKEAQLKAAESNEKVYPYQRTFVFLPSSGGKEAEQ